MAALFQRLEKFQSKSAGKAADGEPVGQDEETERLEVENRKLQYRIGILQRAVEDLSQVPQPSTDGMVNILAELERLFDGAVAAAFPDLTDRPPVVVQTADPRHGDYQYNGAMEVCKLLSAKGPKRNPREVGIYYNQVLSESRREYIVSIKFPHDSGGSCGDRRRATAPGRRQTATGRCLLRERDAGPRLSRPPARPPRRPRSPPAGRNPKKEGPYSSAQIVDVQYR